MDVAVSLSSTRMGTQSSNSLRENTSEDPDVGRPGFVVRAGLR